MEIYFFDKQRINAIKKLDSNAWATGYNAAVLCVSKPWIFCVLQEQNEMYFDAVNINLAQ